MNIPALQPKVNAADLPLEQLAGNKSVSDAQKVAEVSRQFEAVLLRQILQEARKPSAAAGSQPVSTSSSVYDDMINNQLADSISRSGSFGLAKSLQTQMAHQVLPNATGQTPAPTQLVDRANKILHK